MRLVLNVTALFVFMLIPLALYSAESHRVLVVSAASDRAGGGPCQLRVVDVESANVTARVQVGTVADAALTREGDLIATTSLYHIAGVGQPHAQLEIFRTTDLSRVQKGFVPVRRNSYKHLPSSAMMQFSPDGKELIVQRMESYKTDEAPIRHTVDDVVLTRLRLELNDDGLFQINGQPTKVLRARTIDFLRTSEWPRITIWNHHLGAIDALDLDANSILTRVPLGDDPILATFDPRHLEKPNIGDQNYRLGFRANMVTSDGKYAYYVPQHSPQDTTRRPFGYLRRVDLTADPPKVLQTSEERQPNLKARVAAVSEAAGALFVAEDKRAPDGNMLPSPVVKTFHTLNLAPAADIATSLSNCDCLATSHDGKYLYALDFAGGMSVVEIATGKEVKVLKDVGNHPALALALP